MTMCGMAGAFSAIFGTPLAATIFTLEVVDVGSMQYAALLPCLVSALLGVFISGKMGLAPRRSSYRPKLPQRRTISSALSSWVRCWPR